MKQTAFLRRFLTEWIKHLTEKVTAVTSVTRVWVNLWLTTRCPPKLKIWHWFFG